jgi:hypothetical protein
MPIWLQIAGALMTFIVTGVGAFVAYNSWKTRALFGEFELKMLTLVREELKVYVRKEEFDTYKITHAKEFEDYKFNHNTEHSKLDKEIGALRQFKHDTRAKLREYGYRIGKMDGTLDKLESENEDERAG